MLLSLDIETLACSNGPLIQVITDGVKPPGTIKKAESIDEWNIEERPNAIKEAIKKTSLDGSYGSICCVGTAIDDEEPTSICGPDEHAILTQFCAKLALVACRATPASTYQFSKVVGHNVSWDLRFLFQRLIINRIPLPSCLPFNEKPWSDRIYDTMLAWNPDPTRRISLDKLCKILGVQTPKSDLDGSRVGEYAKAGLWDAIAEYCRKDVAATRACYKRMT